ncbi:tetratricopeptide repeat protein 33-like isoform X2 [Varroa destructor]|nr:tetratricopeptide repeat protein 33-like isoform X2 [Varroa destructor]
MSSVQGSSIWKRRAPRLNVSCWISNDNDEEDTVPMDFMEFKNYRSYEERGQAVGDKNFVSSNRHIGRGSRKRVNLITDEEFRITVDRIDSMCQKELWGSALGLIDELLARRCDEKVFEMKAQILMELRRDYDAIRCCDASIKLNPLWWEAHHTHARALLVFGEPHLALKAFQRALRLNPADEEVWKELHWTRYNTSGSVPTESSDFKKLVKKR